MPSCSTHHTFSMAIPRNLTPSCITWSYSANRPFSYFTKNLDHCIIVVSASVSICPQFSSYWPRVSWSSVWGHSLVDVWACSDVRANYNSWLTDKFPGIHSHSSVHAMNSVKALPLLCCRKKVDSHINSIKFLETWKLVQRSICVFMAIACLQWVMNTGENQQPFLVSNMETLRPVNSHYWPIIVFCVGRSKRKSVLNFSYTVKVWRVLYENSYSTYSTRS